MDGDDEFSAHVFSLMESSTLLLRKESADPFGMRALVVSERPALVLAQGHYFEVQVVSVFKTPGPPDRPRELNPRHRSEGLLIGFTRADPFEARELVATMTDVPLSWSVS